MQWNYFGVNESTWEMVDQMWAMYPSFFVSLVKAALIYVLVLCLVMSIHAYV